MVSARHVIRRETPRLRSSDTPKLEWLLGIIGILLLGSGVGFLLHEGLTRDDEPGAVTATVIEIHDTGGVYLVRFSVHNSGGEALSQLHVAARLIDGSVELESARATIDYLPGHSMQQGGFYFKRYPRRYALEIKPEGFMTP
jgi:uncharacterized protein (TIGR02588 family)